MLAENLSRRHSGEEFIRSKSIQAIERSPDLLAHIEMIEASMDSLDYFARSYKATNEDELTLQLLLIRLFNATASGHTDNVRKGALRDCQEATRFGVRWPRFSGQFGGLAKVDSGFDYAASFSSFACVS